MLVIDFLLGMLGGGLVHKFLEKKEADDRSYYEKPEWEEIRKIPGRIFWTIALPLFVMAAVSRDATAIAGWLILICLVMYGIFHFGFSVAGLFLPWGPGRIGDGQKADGPVRHALSPGEGLGEKGARLPSDRGDEAAVFRRPFCRNCADPLRRGRDGRLPSREDLWANRNREGVKRRPGRGDFWKRQNSGPAEPRGDVGFS
ncbi:MAG: hypothetical protein D084_Lepto4C00627G0002 [Leptospirillum sp. Group IV 'UBA BS']|nr:MAG: hypothetical protein D084_Lepto4C00627G0002 [Leptospirillum sp. Group IV 'UBA BS']